MAHVRQKGRKSVADDVDACREGLVGAAMASLAGCDVERAALLGRWSARIASVAMAAAVARAVHVLVLELGSLWRSRMQRCVRKGAA